MTFSESYKTCFAKFTTWQGRASRSEFWYFYLFALICYVVAAIIDNVLGTTFKFMNPVSGMEQSLGYGYAYVLTGLVVLDRSYPAGRRYPVSRVDVLARHGWQQRLRQ